MIEYRPQRGVRLTPRLLTTGEAPISGNAYEAGRRFALILTFATLLLLGAALPASASPADLSRAQREAAELRAQVERMDMQLEMAAEDYAYAKVELDKVQRALEENEAVLAQAEKDLETASARLEKRVRGMYMDGSTGLLQAILTASSFSEFMNRLEFLARLGQQDGEVFEQVAAFRTEVDEKKDALAAQRTEQTRLVAQAQEAQAAVERGLKEREQALKGKEAQVAQLEREEQERQARLVAEAKEAARRAAQESAAREAAARGNQRSQTSATTSGSTGSGGSTGGASSSGSSGSGSTTKTTAAEARSAPAPSKVGGSVVDIALSMVGVPYRWGGSTPSGFDCSGLTMWAYAKVGVSLPHSSRAQFSSGRAVSRDELRPGDLVFFGSPIHHVGMYVGGGNMVHAPNTGSRVRVNSMDRRDYVGARRLG